MAARFFGKIPPLFAALEVAGHALGGALPTFVVDGGEGRPRQWPEFFRGLLYSVGLTPLALYERTTMFREWPGRRRDDPPGG